MIPVFEMVDRVLRAGYEDVLHERPEFEERMRKAERRLQALESRVTRLEQHESARERERS